MTKPSYEELETKVEEREADLRLALAAIQDLRPRAEAAETSLARVRGLLQRLFTFARHTEECYAWGYHRPTGSYWANGDENKCYCPLGKIFREALPSGAESADIGKLDTADNKDEWAIKVGEVLGSAETGGEKAAPEMVCPTCCPQGGFHHIDCPNQPGGAYNNRFTDWPLSTPESREPEKLNNAQEVFNCSETEAFHRAFGVPCSKCEPVSGAESSLSSPPPDKDWDADVKSPLDAETNPQICATCQKSLHPHHTRGWAGHKFQPSSSPELLPTQLDK
jgi:hypothetical protein